MKIAVLGAGIIGSGIARALAEDPEVSAVIVADVAPQAAEHVAAALGPKATPQPADVRDIAQTAAVIRGAAAVVNATLYRFNLAAMRAALQAGCHYVDLGGLFHLTREQLALDGEFRAAGLTAALGCGGAPGLSNLLARYAADRLDRVDAIAIRCGAYDPTPPTAGLSVPYSLTTVLDEFTVEPEVFADGEWRAAPPLSGGEPVEFPEPVGRVIAFHTLHSETLTLAMSYRDKGLRQCDFKIAFSPDFENKLRFLIALGLAGQTPVMVNGASIAPRDLLLALAAAQPSAPAIPGDVDAVRAVVRGAAGGEPVAFTVDALTPWHTGWNVSGGVIDTAVPAALAARRLASGQITRRGALPPEAALEPETLFGELARYGTRVRVRHETWLGAESGRLGGDPQITLRP